MTKNAVQLPDSITPPMLAYDSVFQRENKKISIVNLSTSEAYSVLIDQNQLDMSNLKYRTIEGEWVEPGIDDLYIQLTADSFRFKGLEKQMLDLHQFPQNMEALRAIYATFGPVLLIDNQININDEEYEATDDVVVNLTRTVKSMNANGIDFLIKKSKEEFLEIEFEG